MTTPTYTPDEIAARLADYVLGQLPDEERSAFETLIAEDESLRREVAGMRERLLELDMAAPQTPPSASLWEKIEAGIEANPDAAPIDLAAHRRARAQAAPRPRWSGSFWRGFAAASVLALLAGGYAYTVVGPKPPRMIVVLLDSEARPVSIVETLDGRSIRVVPLGKVAVPEGKTLQVWTLPDKTTGPVSMGLIDRLGTTTLTGPALPEPKPDQLYEITIEPAGGSPTGKPTGPIVGKGFARTPQI